MKKKVLLRAPVLTHSGYGVHSRQVFKWLEKKDIELFVQPLMWGDTPWMIDSKDALTSRIMSKTRVPEGVKFDYTFQLQLPNEWDSNLGHYNFGMSAMVESNIANPEWVNHCNKMNCIIAPSSHAKMSITNSGKVTVPFKVIPESFIEEIEIGENKEIDLSHIKTDFNFLMFGQITGNTSESDRKNTFQSLKWICDTFKNDKDVGVIIKTNCGKNTVQDRYRTREMLSGLMSSFRPGDFPKVYLLHGNMESSEVASLYRSSKIKALVSFTRGEGFGLPILEAAASDLPIITTNWSGHLDFMNRGKFIGVDYDLVDVPKERIDNKIFVKGSRWAEPREFMAKKALKKFRDASEIPKQWAENLGQIIREEYSQSAIEKKYDQLLVDLDLVL